MRKIYAIFGDACWQPRWHPAAAQAQAKSRRWHADDAAEHRAYAGHHRPGPWPLQERRRRRQHRRTRWRRQGLRAMLAGNVDVGMSPGALTIVGAPKGRRPKAILANVPKFEASMVVRDNVKTMADLKGKRIGIQEPGGFADILSRSVLRAAKIDPEGREFRQHRHRGRAGSGGRPGRHRDPPCRAGDAGQDEGARPARHRAHVGCCSPRSSIPSRRSPRRPSRKSRRRCRPSSTPTSRRRASCTPTRPRCMPIMVKHTGYPEKVVERAYDFMVKNCIWDANSGLGAERVEFHRRVDDQGRQHPRRQDAEIRGHGRRLVRQEGDREARRMEGPGLPDGGVLELALRHAPSWRGGCGLERSSR